MKRSVSDIALQILSRAIFYRRSQHWSLDQIQAYQDKMLKRIVQHSHKHVPYYRKLFKDIGLDVDGFRGREDMNKIPILDKDTVRIRMEEFYADNYQEIPHEWDSTSGSTGTPLNLMISKKTKAAKHAAIVRSFSWAGFSLRKRAVSLGGKSSHDEYSIDKIRNVLRLNSYRLKPENAPRYLEMMNAWKPKILHGNSYSFIWIGKFAKDHNISLPRPESIITYGDTLSARKRELLESIYECEVFDFYSHHESVAIISECEHHSMHIFDDFAYNEVVNEKGEDARGEGSGQLVGTSFNNYAMPLIRYGIGDLVEIREGRTCTCGRHLTVLDSINGRQNDILETPDGRFLSNSLEHTIDKGKGVIMAQCVQDARDHLYLNLIVEKAFNEDSWNEIRSDLHSIVGESMKIDYRKVEELELNQGGKSPFILSKIGHSYE